MSGVDWARSRLAEEALEKLRGGGIIPQIAGVLRASAQSAAENLRAAVVGEIPGFALSNNPDVLPDLDRHGTEHVHEVIRLFAGENMDDFAFVVAHARRRAEQRFPLELTLHSYRCGHRVLSHWLRDAAAAMLPRQAERAVSAIADFAIEYTDVVSSIAAAEYVAHTRRLAEAEGDQRTELLNILLSGYDEADGRVARILKQAGYLEQRQSYCVAAVRPVNVLEMDGPERGQRIIVAIADTLAHTTVRLLAGVRSGMVTAVLSDRRRQSGWTTPQQDLMERLVPRLELLGVSVLTGISNDHPSTAFIPKALQEAVTALGFATVERRVVSYGSLVLRELLLHRAADHLHGVAPLWIAPLLQAEGEGDSSLLETLRAMAAADLNVQEAARHLSKHPNTIYARVARIKAMTGRDPQRFHDLSELLLAVDCWKQ